MVRTRYSPRKSVFHVAPLLAGLILSACGDQLAPTDAPGEPTRVSRSHESEGLVQFGGASNVVALDGNRAWLGLGPRVVGLDVARPEAPVTLAQSAILPGVVVGLAPDPAHGLVWAALGEGGVAALQVAEGADLAVARQVDLGAPARDVAVWGDHVFVAADPADLLVLDVAGTVIGRYATSPKHRRKPPDPYHDPMMGLELRDGLAFLVTSTTGLHILDVADPAAPRWLGKLAMSSDAGDIALDGDLAYLTGYPLSIVDISEPANPRVVWPQGGETREADEADFPLYVSSVAVENGLWVANHQLVDVRIPERPAVMASLLPADDGGAFSWHSRPAIRDGVSYLPAGQRDGGLRIVDVSDPAAPRELWQASAPGLVTAILASDGRLRVPIADNVMTLDVRDPAEPRVLEPSDGPDGRGWMDRPVLATDTHFYYGHDRELSVSTLTQVQGVPIPAKTPVFTLPIQSNPTDVVQQGDYLYLTDSGWDFDIPRRGPTYFEIVDVSDAERPRVAASLELQYPLYAVAVAGDTAWVSQHEGDRHSFPMSESKPDAPSEVLAIDISDPTAPFVRDRVHAKAAVADLLIAGSTLYAATDLGWQTFEVGDGTLLKPGGLRPLPDFAWRMALADGMLWIANGAAGVVGLSIASPAPKITGAPPRLPVFAGTGAVAPQEPTATPTGWAAGQGLEPMP